MLSSNRVLRMKWQPKQIEFVSLPLSERAKKITQPFRCVCPLNHGMYWLDGLYNPWLAIVLTPLFGFNVLVHAFLRWNQKKSRGFSTKTKELRTKEEKLDHPFNQTFFSVSLQRRIFDILFFISILATFLRRLVNPSCVLGTAILFCSSTAYGFSKEKSNSLVMLR